MDQEIIRAGDYCVIIQQNGETCTANLNTPHLHLTHVWKLYSSDKNKDYPKTSFLNPYREASTFIGRKDLLSDFMDWVNSEDKISIRILTGEGGSGKTRFAMQLCKNLPEEWNSGFVEQQEAIRFQNQKNLKQWGWGTPCLIIFDYAMSQYKTLANWFNEIKYNRGIEGAPLRILLIERHANMELGWCETIFGTGHDSAIMRERCNPNHPIAIPPITDPAEKINIISDMLQQIGSKKALTSLDEDPELEKKLVRNKSTSDPLYLLMVAFTFHHSSQNVLDTLNIDRIDLATSVARHEYSRITKACENNQLKAKFVAHLLAFYSLCQGKCDIPLLELIRSEAKELGFDNSQPADIESILIACSPSREHDQIAPIQPDLIAECFIALYLGNRHQLKSKESVLRAYIENPDGTFSTLERCLQNLRITQHEEGNIFSKTNQWGNHLIAENIIQDDHKKMLYKLIFTSNSTDEDADIFNTKQEYNSFAL